jgi:hypothetical protein
VTPESPRIALDDTGKPIFALIQYRRPVDQLTEDERRTKLGGGLLTFSVDLARTAEQEQAIRTALANDLAFQNDIATRATDRIDYSKRWADEFKGDLTKLAAAITMGAVPADDGTVAVAIAGEDTGHTGEFVSNLVGAGKVSMTGDERAAFAAKLTQDGSTLLWDMVENNLPGILVQYQLKFTSRLDGVTMLVHCDAAKAYHAIQEQWAHIADEAAFSDTEDGSSSTLTFDASKSDSAGSRLLQTAMSSQTSWVKIIAEAGPEVVTPEMQAQLQQQGYQMIHDFLSDTFLEYKPDFTPAADPDLKTTLAQADGKPFGRDSINFYNLKKLDVSAVGDLNFKLETKSTVDTWLDPSGNLSNILNGQQVSQFRTQIDLDAAFYRFESIQVLCTANFDADPVDLVKAHLEYHGTSPNGRIDTVKDLAFEKTSGPQFFTTYLGGSDQRTYDYTVDVYYRGSSKTYQLSGRSNETVLVLDTDALGIVSVDLQLGFVDWTKIDTVLVKMSYGSGPDGLEEEFSFTSGNQGAKWVVPYGKAVDQDYAYQVTWVDKSGQHIEDAPATSRSKKLLLDQPLRDTLNVTLVPAGSFGADGLLSKIVVAVRYEDQPHKYSVAQSFVLTSDKDVVTWSVPLLDHDLRQYSYQVSVFYSDGLTRSEDTWSTTDKTVLPVGDPFGYRVQFLPYLLKGGPYVFGTLHVSFVDDATKITAEKDFQITDYATPIVWRFRLGSPDRHQYSYQLALFKADGTSVTVGPQSETRELVVLKPPTP